MFTTCRHLLAVTMIMVASSLYSLQAKAITNENISIITLIPYDDLVIPVPTPFNPDGVTFYGDFNGIYFQFLVISISIIKKYYNSFYHN